MRDIIRKKNIVILGAGFGGLKCALEIEKHFQKLHIKSLPRHLKKQHAIYHKIISRFQKQANQQIPQKNKKCNGLFEKYNIVLTNKNSYQLYTPAMYETASTFMHDADTLKLKEITTISIEEAKKNKKIKFIQNEIEKINLENNTVTFKDGNFLDFEYLVIAIGCKTNYFNIPGLEENSVSFKNFNDSLKIRNLLLKFTNELSEIKIVIGGAGVSGVEISAELMGYINRLKNNFPGKNYNLTIIEADNRILPGFNEKISAIAENRLKKLGVSIICDKEILTIEKNKIFFKNEETPIDFTILIWTGGIKPNPIINELNILKENKKKIIEVNDFMNCISATQNLSLNEKIFAIGDITCAYAPETKITIPMNTKIAINQAKIAAKNIINDILRKPKQKYSSSKHSPYIISVGKKYAIFKINSFAISGFIAWLIKILIHLNYLLSILPFKKACRVWRQAVKIYIKND